MKTQHTPGPWYAVEVHVQSARLNEDNYICEAEGNTREQAEANARLLAAAPDLLAALHGLVQQVIETCKTRRFNDGPLCLEVESARAAIAKAEGRE